MAAIFETAVANATMATLLAIIVLLATRVCSNPYFTRGLWIVVLLKFVAPPLFFLHLPIDFWTRTTADRSVERADAAVSMAEESVLIEGEAGTPSSNGSLHGVKSNSGANAVGSPQALASLPTSIRGFRTVIWLSGIVWFFGAAVMGVLVLSRISRFHRLIQRATLASGKLQKQMEALASKIGLKRLPLLRLADGNMPPLVWCVGKRPTILLPASLLSRLKSSSITSILAHELTHIRRKDSWARWLELVVVTLYWWCPTAWIARHKLQEAEEQCCDADVLRFFPALRRRYATAVLETLELLTDGHQPKLGGTGFGSGNSLKRRFEMIVNQKPAEPLTGGMRGLTVGLVAAALCLAPAATLSSKQAELPTASAVGDAPCTVTLQDGTKLEGHLVEAGGGRVVVLSSVPAGMGRASTGSEEHDGFSTEDGASAWDVELDECFRIALSHLKDAHIVDVDSTDEMLIVAQRADSRVDSLDFRESVESELRDVEVAYWNLFGHLRNLEARKSGRDRSLELWREVKAHTRSGNLSADHEANYRGQYFLFRSQVEQATTEVYRAEAMLRYLLGLTPMDGRLIRPASTPRDASSDFDWDQIQREALMNRIEIVKQRRQVKARKNNVQEARDDRHKDLLLTREESLLHDMELEVCHQLGDSVRQVELAFQLLQTNRNRAVAASKEFEAVSAVQKDGRVRMDVLLDCQRRKIEAEVACTDALTEYQRCLVEIHRRKGTLLSKCGVSLANAPCDSEMLPE